MQIVAQYSHLNGFEYLCFHKRDLWEEIKDIISSVDAKNLKTKISKEKNKRGKLLYSPKKINESFKKEFQFRGWQESKTAYWVTKDAELIQKTMSMNSDEQKNFIKNSNQTPIYSYNQTDFVKDRIAVEVQLGKYPFVAFDLFVKHMAFFIGDVIDLGIEILPMKEMQAEMSSGPAYYEGEIYNLIRQGRGTPAVPLILIGIAP